VSGIDILARTIVGEARGEGKPGMTAVANVVMNRVAAAKLYLAQKDKPHALFGDGSVASACLAKWQFSCWNAGDPNRAIIEALGPDKAIFIEALDIAGKAVTGQLPDQTNGATHYFDRRMTTPPKWAAGQTPCHTEGHHLFFKGV
jgi:spore germination cell wall hydrolase CwlJ-like protein